MLFALDSLQNVICCKGLFGVQNHKTMSTREQLADFLIINCVTSWHQYLWTVHTDSMDKLIMQRTCYHVYMI